MKKMLAILFVFASVCSFAQEQDNKRFIEVQGTSKLEVVPDVAYFSILLTDNQKENIYVEKQEVELGKILKKYEIPSENLTIDKLSGLRQKVSFWGTKDVVNQKLMTLKITNLSVTDKLLDEISKLKINSISLQKVESSNIEKYKSEACIQAAKNAKNKAADFAKGLEVTLSSPMNLYEQNLSVSGDEEEIQPRYYMMSKANSESADADSGMQQNFKNIVIRCNVRLKAEIK